MAGHIFQQALAAGDKPFVFEPQAVPDSLNRPRVRPELVEVHVECGERIDVPRNLEVLCCHLNSVP